MWRKDDSILTMPVKVYLHPNRFCCCNFSLLFVRGCKRCPVHTFLQHFANSCNMWPWLTCDISGMTRFSTTRKFPGTAEVSQRYVRWTSRLLKEWQKNENKSVYNSVLPLMFTNSKKSRISFIRIVQILNLFIRQWNNNTLSHNPSYSIWRIFRTIFNMIKL